MNRKLAILLILSLMPFAANAKIQINNKTDFYGTANIKGGDCSSGLGDSGVMKPHGSISLSTVEIIALCGFKNCDAYLFMTKDCSGSKLATVTINRNGIKGVQNHHPDEFNIVANGNSATIESLKLKGRFFNWLKWIF